MLETVTADTMKGRILIVEDEEGIREMLGYALGKEGFVFDEADSVDTARLLVEKEAPDLILMDWMLPGMSGLDYAKKLRKNPETREIPIIMLTARTEEADKIRGLDCGADDYITKPFSTRELVARINAVLRRSRAEVKNGIIDIEGLSLDVGKPILETSRITSTIVAVPGKWVIVGNPILRDKEKDREEHVAVLLRINPVRLDLPKEKEQNTIQIGANGELELNCSEVELDGLTRMLEKKSVLINFLHAMNYSIGYQKNKNFNYQLFGGTDKNCNRRKPL